MVKHRQTSTWYITSGRKPKWEDATFDFVIDDPNLQVHMWLCKGYGPRGLVVSKDRWYGFIVFVCVDIWVIDSEWLWYLYFCRIFQLINFSVLRPTDPVDVTNPNRTSRFHQSKKTDKLPVAPGSQNLHLEVHDNDTGAFSWKQQLWWQLIVGILQLRVLFTGCVGGLKFQTSSWLLSSFGGTHQNWLIFKGRETR